MNKTKNGWFKAVSIISLILAIMSTIVSAVSLLLTLTGFGGFSQILSEIAGAGGDEASGLLAGLLGNIQLLMIVYELMMVVGILISYLAYAKFKKFACMTKTELKPYNASVIIWIVLMFIFSGLLIGVLALVGYFCAPKEEYEVAAVVEPNEVNVVVDKQPTNTDATIERLEKLQRVKDSGAITDEEYEMLKQRILKDN